MVNDQRDDAPGMTAEDVAVLARYCELHPSEQRLPRLAEELTAALEALADLDDAARRAPSAIADPFDASWPSGREGRAS